MLIRHWIFLILSSCILLTGCNDQEVVDPDPQGRPIEQILEMDRAIYVTLLDPVQNILYFTVPGFNHQTTDIYFLNLDSQDLEFKTSTEGQIDRMALSEDNKILAFSTIDGRLNMFDVTANENRELFQLNGFVAREFSPDNQFLVVELYSEQGNSLYRLDIQTNDTLKLYEGNFWYIGITFDNQILVYELREATIFLVDWEGSKSELSSVELRPEIISEDGTVVIGVKIEGRGDRIYSYNFQTNRSEFVIQSISPTESFNLAGYSVDKNSILIKTDRDNPGSYIFEIYVVDKSGENMERLTYDIDHDEDVIGFYDNDSKVLFKTDKDYHYGLYSIDLKSSQE